MTSLTLQHFSRDERHREHDRHWGSIRQEEGGHSPRDRTGFGNRGRSVKQDLHVLISVYNTALECTDLCAEFDTCRKMRHFKLV